MSVTRPPAPAGVRQFFDAEGRLRQWPTKRRHQGIVLDHLVALFEPGRRYHEREVNEILRGAHTFDDWALLRRALVDDRRLEREGDGSAYWRTEPRESEEDPAA